MSTPQVLQALIDKFDTRELVREQIAAILLSESLNQQQFARLASKDPQGWALRLFTERNGNCWHNFTSAPVGRDTDDESIDPTPIVNVWHATTGYDRQRSAPSGRQQATTTYHLDIYGCGIATQTALGHDSGDMLAALEVERAYRLIRNTLLSPINEQLQLLGVVGNIWILSFKTGPVDTTTHDNPRVENVAVGRVELEVSYLEYAPEYEGVTIEAITGTVKRAGTGEIYFKTTPPLGV